MLVVADLNMKIVKNKTLKKDPSKTRAVANDSPLRYPMNVHMTDTHERRIEWLQYENSKICEEYLSAQLLYAIALLKRKQKSKEHINLSQYKALNNAFALWEEVKLCGESYHTIWMKSLEDSFKYHYAGDEDLKLEEEIDE